MTPWEKIRRALGLPNDSALAAELRQEALDRLAHSLLVNLEKDAGQTGPSPGARRVRGGGPRRAADGWPYVDRELFARRVKARAATHLRVVEEGADAPAPEHVAIEKFETPQGRCRLLEGRGMVFVEFWEDIAPKTLTLGGMPYDLSPVDDAPIFEVLCLSPERAHEFAARRARRPDLYSLKWTEGRS